MHHCRGWIRRIRYRLEFAAFLVVVTVVRRLPERCVLWGVELLTALMVRLPKRWTRGDVVEHNLRAAFGTDLDETEIDRIRRGMWRHLFLLVAEVVREVPRLTEERTVELVRFHRKTDVLQALLSDRPVILVSGHVGNWELAVAVFGVWGFPMFVVARDLDNPHLDRWFRRYRQATGHTMLSKRHDQQAIVDAVAAGRSIALLGDQDAGLRGIFVDFFGRPASTYKSIALLALQFDAVLCVGYALRLDEPSTAGGPAAPRFEIGCEEVIDPRTIDADDPIHEVTQRFTSALERVVRRAPDQYFWLHRRWKTRPEDFRKNRKRRRPKGPIGPVSGTEAA